MSAFADSLGHAKINAAHIRRNAVLLDLNSALRSIRQLDKENPKVRIFLNLEKEVESLLSKVKSENNMMVQLMLSASSDVSSDSNFTTDQSSVNSATLVAIQTVDDFRTILEEKGLVPTLQEEQAAATAGGAVSGDFSDVMKQLSKNLLTLTEIGKQQADSGKKQAEALQSAKGPKPVQPIFSPKGDLGDYLNFKNFKDNFNYFVRNVPENKDKLKWLMSSVKGDAYEQIKGLSLENNNFDIAVTKLERKYMSREKILKAIFTSIYQYKNANPDKSYTNVLQGLTSLENNIQDLKVSHKLDCTIGAADKLISLIIFSNLPSQLRTELINTTGSTYPSVNQIFENIEKVVDKVNMANGVGPGCIKKPSSDVTVNTVSSKSKRKKKK